MFGITGSENVYYQDWNELFQLRHYQAALIGWAPALQQDALLCDYVIAITAHNDATTLEASLQSCLKAMHNSTAKGRIVLLCYNCRDHSTMIAARWARRNAVALDTIEINLPPIDHLSTRQRALALLIQMSRFLISPRGVVMTTTADAAICEDWVKANLENSILGAALICGKADYHSDDHNSVWQARAHEQQYYILSRILEHYLDPDPFNPAGTHLNATPSSLAFTTHFIDNIRFDSALLTHYDVESWIKAAHAHDLPVQHCQIARADLPFEAVNDNRDITLESPCLDHIESVAMLIRRLSARATFRRLVDQSQDLTVFLKRLGLDDLQINEFHKCHTFGSKWLFVEQTSPMLRRTPLRYGQLPEQMQLLEEALDRLQQNAA